MIKCGPSGHNIRSGPSTSSSAIGVLRHGDAVNIVEVKQDQRSRGDIWLRIRRDEVKKYTFVQEDDGDSKHDEEDEEDGFVGHNHHHGWCLAVSATDVQYLRKDGESDEDELLPKVASPIKVTRSCLSRYSMYIHSGSTVDSG